MKRRDFIALLGGAAAAWPLAARATQAERMRRIGVLMGYPEGDPQAQANVTALLEGLQNLGWIEGRNVQIDYRWAGGDPDKARTFARELIATTPDVMVPSTNQVTRILQQETQTIPIVFAFVGDPVGSGFAASLARPGKNITGFANFENSIGGKWVELFQEIAPPAGRVGFVFNPDAAPNVGFFHAAEAAAPSLGDSQRTFPGTSRAGACAARRSARPRCRSLWLTCRCRSTMCWQSQGGLASIRWCSPLAWSSIALMGVAANVVARLLQKHRWIAYVGLAIILYVACGGPFVARGGGEKMLISYNSAVFDVVPVTVAYQQVSPPPVGRSAM